MSRTPPEPLPHDPWATHYESVMSQTFGALYDQMTEWTLAEVDRLVGVDATVLDLGAGAGRMALPLAGSGRRVIAVERSGPMVEALRLRVGATEPAVAARLRVEQASGQEAGGLGPVDIALSVFTVIAYCLTEAELSGLFEAAAGALRPGGPFLLDVPGDEVFAPLEIETGSLIRDVSMAEREPGHFDYAEHTVIRTTAGAVEYRDAFSLRRWCVEEVDRLLRHAGFDSIQDVSERFPGLGARYLVARTAEVSSTAG